MEKKVLAISFESCAKELFSSEQVEILQLYLIEDLSYREIAKVLRIKEAQVTQRIARALYELKKVSNDPEFVKARKILYGEESPATNDHDDHDKKLIK
jgi:DNA-directed RNA polymerase specialized sigma24 family protein